MPWRFRSSKMWPRQGLSTMGTIGLGRLIVSGRRRLPSPPAMTTACIARSLVGGRVPTRDTRAGRLKRGRVRQEQQNDRGEGSDRRQWREVDRPTPAERLIDADAERIGVSGRDKDRSGDEEQPLGPGSGAPDARE